MPARVRGFWPWTRSAAARRRDPNGDSLTFETQAAQLHEVVQAVRTRALSFVPPAVVTLGPSVGADIVIVETGTYHDVDPSSWRSHTSQLQPELFASM